MSISFADATGSPSTVLEIIRALGPNAAPVVMAVIFLWVALKLFPMAKEITGEWAKAHREASATSAAALLESARMCKQSQDEQNDVIRQFTQTLGESKGREERVMRILERIEGRQP